jgi:hypothetical protein
MAEVSFKFNIGEAVKWKDDPFPNRKWIVGQINIDLKTLRYYLINGKESIWMYEEEIEIFKEDGPVT